MKKEPIITERKLIVFPNGYAIWYTEKKHRCGFTAFLGALITPTNVHHDISYWSYDYRINIIEEESKEWYESISSL
jgi:hypothetical protein